MMGTGAPIVGKKGMLCVARLCKDDRLFIGGLTLSCHAASLISQRELLGCAGKKCEYKTEDGKNVGSFLDNETDANAPWKITRRSQGQPPYEERSEKRCRNGRPSGP